MAGHGIDFRGDRRNLRGSRHCAENKQKEKAVMISDYIKILEGAYITLYGSALLPFRQRVYEELPYVISFAVPLPRAVVREIAAEGPTKTYFHHYRTCNSYIDHVSYRLTLAIRKAGYDALYVPASQSVSKDGFQGLFPHKTAAVLCGLGGIGMNGLLVTAKYGAAVRLGTVMTDMPVPQAEQIENPCRRCGCCVRACPSGALYGTAWKDKTPVQDILDVQLCSAYMKKTYREIGRGAVCGICMAACPVGAE